MDGRRHRRRAEHDEDKALGRMDVAPVPLHLRLILRTARRFADLYLDDTISDNNVMAMKANVCSTVGDGADHLHGHRKLHAQQLQRGLKLKAQRIAVNDLRHARAKGTVDCVRRPLHHGVHFPVVRWW